MKVKGIMDMETVVRGVCTSHLSCCDCPFLEIHRRKDCRSKCIAAKQYYKEFAKILGLEIVDEPAQTVVQK